jgi:hypothetical protein
MRAFASHAMRAKTKTLPWQSLAAQIESVVVIVFWGPPDVPA